MYFTVVYTVHARCAYHLGMLGNGLDSCGMPSFEASRRGPSVAIVPSSPQWLASKSQLNIGPKTASLHRGLLFSGEGLQWYIRSLCRSVLIITYGTLVYSSRLETVVKLCFDQGRLYLALVSKSAVRA